MQGDYLQAYQSFFNEKEKIKNKKITKISYLLKLKAQQNSISDLDRKHKAWGLHEIVQNSNWFYY